MKTICNHTPLSPYRLQRQLFAQEHIERALTNSLAQGSSTQGFHSLGIIDTLDLEAFDPVSGWRLIGHLSTDGRYCYFEAHHTILPMFQRMLVRLYATQEKTMDEAGLTIARTYFELCDPHSRIHELASIQYTFGFDQGQGYSDTQDCSQAQGSLF